MSSRAALRAVVLMIAMIIVGHLTLYAIRLGNAHEKRLDPEETDKLYRGLGRIAKFAGYNKIARKLIVAHAVAEMGGLGGNALWRGWNMWGLIQPKTWADRWNWLFPHMLAFMNSRGVKYYFLIFASQAEAFLVYKIIMERKWPAAAKALDAGDVDGFLYGLNHGVAGAWGTNTDAIRLAFNSPKVEGWAE